MNKINGGIFINFAKNNMQNAKIKCGLTEESTGQYSDDIINDSYVWYEKNWQHDEYEHIHQRSQLTYVEEGYQYFHIDQRIYLVPRNYVIWIPSGKKHRITSEAKTVNLMVALFKSAVKKDFYQDVHVFVAPTVLKEMLLYASKWNKLLTTDEEQSIFLNAILSNLSTLCKESNFLHIPVPTDSRLIPICNYINTNYSYQVSIDEFANMANMSTRSLQRIFKQKTGITLQKYVQLIRIFKSMELINENQHTLSQIAFKVGYKSLSAFTSSYVSIMRSRPKLKK